MRRSLLTVLSGLLLWAGPAAALPMQEIWTLDASVTVNVGGATVRFDPVDALMMLDYTQVMCKAGPCDIFTEDWVVFTATATAGTIDEVGMALLQTAPQSGSVSAGYFTAYAGVPPTSADVTTNPNSPNFTVVPSLDASGGDVLTAPLFVGYPDGYVPTDGGPFAPNNAQFMARSGGSAQAQFGIVNTSFYIAPEPGTALLFGTGLLGLAFSARRRRV